MEISACPVCGSKDIRYERTTVDRYRLDSWRSADDRPVFVVEPEILESNTADRVVCVNGHAHPDRIGFDLEWAQSG